jgi:DNA mismatch endonuclease (patch repair protein)
MDRLSPAARSWNMSRIRGRDTAPELTVRHFLHREGLRFRLRNHGLPGKPDLVFKSRRICVFVHGCFWHGCSRCAVGRRKVQTNTQFWAAKVARNQARDRRTVRKLRRSGWKAFTVWECETKKLSRLAALARRIRNVAPRLALSSGPRVPSASAVRQETASSQLGRLRHRAALNRLEASDL